MTTYTGSLLIHASALRAVQTEDSTLRLKDEKKERQREWDRGGGGMEVL